ncbi:cell division protein FtsQ/DivIB [Flavobacterium sp.]
MKFFTWINIRLVLMFSLVIFLYSFTSFKNNHRKIAKVEVRFLNNDTPFVKAETVNKLLIEKNNNTKTFTKETLVLNKLENSINQEQLIQKAEVFVSVDGVLKAVVKQKTPLGRISAENSSFYIDYEGDIMPFSENYTARVPLISGEIKNVKKEKLAQVLRTIYEDEFLQKNIIGIQVLPNGSLILENRNYDFGIDFGRMINIDRKFNNYKAFFQKAVADSTLNKYRMINLKFTQQVVCIK